MNSNARHTLLALQRGPPSSPPNLFFSFSQQRLAAGGLDVLRPFYSDRILYSVSAGGLAELELELSY